jgi:ubiquinone/menaquinone biosynthesis C-methylase UbiE
MARINYEAVARDYEAARALPLDAMSAWRDAVTPHVGEHARILDLGAGTGVFADAFARWFGASVVAVEPASAMLAEALRLRPHPRVAYVGGTATAIPVADASCHAAWLSTMIHHVPDLPACARDVRRVLRPGAAVLIRGSFPGRHEQITLFRYFPGASHVASTFPTVEATIAAFEAAGFAFQSLGAVPQASAPSLAAFAEGVRLRRHADTTLAPLSEDEIAAGLRAIDADAAAVPPAPVIDYLDLLVLK